MRGTSRREDDVFWIIRLDDPGEEHRSGARFVARFTKNRNSQEGEPARLWSFTTHANGEVTVDVRDSSTLATFRQWVSEGLTRATDIAAEMGISKGSVSKLAKRAMGEGWLGKKGLDYVLIESGNTHSHPSISTDA